MTTLDLLSMSVDSIRRTDSFDEARSTLHQRLGTFGPRPTRRLGDSRRIGESPLSRYSTRSRNSKASASAAVLDATRIWPGCAADAQRGSLVVDDVAVTKVGRPGSLVIASPAGVGS
jgi:hypothetical protein